MAKALVLFLVAVGVGLLAYWAATYRLASQSQHAVPTRGGRASGGDPDPGARSGDGHGFERPGNDGAKAGPSTGPIEPPRTAQQREHDDLESRRGPLYSGLHRDMGSALIAVRPSDEDAATLDLYASQDAPNMTITLLNQAIQANVAYYGFRHIRFFVPNPPRSLERYRLDSEANADSAGNWQTFRK